MKMIFKQTLMAAAVTLAATPVLAAYSDAGTDYSKAQTQTWTWTPGLDPLNTANQILCFINNLRADAMVNKGQYSALVDMNACQAGQSDGSSKGPDNMFAIVNSTRADNSSPEEVDVWVPQMAQGNGSTGQIHAHAEVTQSPSSSNPSGQFTMTYQMYDVTNLSGNPIEEGQLKSLPNSNGQIDLSFFASSSTHGNMAVSVVKDPNGASGAAITQGVDYQTNNSVTFKMAWDDSTAPGLVNIQAPTGNVCLNKNDITNNVYQYGLYDATTGAAIPMNGGFPFEYTKSDGSTGNGYLGYWGAWMDDNSTVTDGMQVQKIDYSTQPPSKQTITLHKSMGQLQQITTQVKKPSDVAKVTFDYWDPNGGQFQVKYLTSLPSTASSGFTTAGFYEVATETMSSNGPPTTSALSTIVLVTPTYGNTVYLNAQQLNGNVVVHYTSGTPDSIVLQKQQTITPDKLNGTLTLYCNYNCPKGGLTTTDIQNGTVWQTTNGTTPVQYTFDPATMVLKDATGNPVVWPTGATGSGEIQDGINSGALFTSATGDISTATSWYNYSTGPNNWNQTTWADDSTGAVIAIDPPLSLSFTFSSADDRNASSSSNGSAYYGNPFLVQYSGDGHIDGLPFVQSGNHYVPAINLADGTQLVNANNSSKVYVVKAIQEEKDPNTGTNCSSLTLPSNGSNGISLPTSVPASDFNAIQPMPSTYDNTPSVINGVIQ